jgi:hypothetical protein
MATRMAADDSHCTYIMGKTKALVELTSAPPFAV